MSVKTNYKKKTHPASFRLSDSAEDVLVDWEKMGHSRSTLVNAVLAKYGRQCAAELTEQFKSFGLLPKTNLWPPSFSNAVAYS